MYAQTYFSSGFYARTYFPNGPVGSAPRYFPHDVFPARYFPDSYFAGDEFAVVVPVKPSYFLHSFFAGGFYPDRYFPGDVPVIETPEPIVLPLTGGLFRYPQHIPTIHGRADLRLPVPRGALRGVVLPAGVQGHVEGVLPWLLLVASGEAVSASITGTSTLLLASLDLAADGRVDDSQAKKAVRRSDGDEEERALLDYYMLTLRGK